MNRSESLSQYFDERVETFGKDFRSCGYQSKWSFLQRQQAVMALLQGREGDRILDVGCGPGLFTAPLSQKHFLVGVDLSFKMLGHARSVLEPVLGNGGLLPFQDKSFDVVMAIETLQHLAEPAAFVKELCCAVKRGGVLILSSLNQNSILHRTLNRFGGYQGLHFHSLLEICQILDQQGLSRHTTQFLGFPFPLIWQEKQSLRPPSGLATSWIVQARK